MAIQTNPPFQTLSMSKPTDKLLTELSQAARQLLLNIVRTPELAQCLDRLRAALEPFDNREVTINTKQEVYVIPAQPKGYTCLGFDVLTGRYNAIAAWLRREGLDASDLPPESRGSRSAYTGYLMLMRRASGYCQRNHLRCPAELTRQLIGLEGKWVEVVDRDGQRRRFIVGKSAGWLPCHLEIARRNSHGGPAVYGAPFQSVRVVA
jgi:hypothetical protein